MRPPYRFLLVPFALIVLILAVCAFAIALGWTLPLAFMNFLEVPDYRWGVAIVSIFLVVMAGWILGAVVQHPREREVIIRESLLGKIKITATALESLIRRAARQVRDVREVRPILYYDRQGLVVVLQMNINPDADLPAVSQDVQDKVQQCLEQKAGVQVHQVQVLIQSVTMDSRLRVE
jgi:uncharacterized membrane protein